MVINHLLNGMILQVREGFPLYSYDLGIGLETEKSYSIREVDLDSLGICFRLSSSKSF